MAIVAVPVEDFRPASQWQIKKTIDEEQFSPVLTHAVTIGMIPAVAGGVLIPIRHMTGKVKDSEQTAVSGRSHTVQVTCEVDDRDSEVWDTVLGLERTECHLILTFHDASRAFVEATRDSYQMTSERDGSKMTVTFRIHNLMGLQMIY